MTATVLEAYDAMAQQFNTAWTAGAPTVPIVWPDVKSDIPDKGVAFCRFTVIHNPGLGGQATLANCQGQRRYRRNGNVIIQLFVPFAGGLRTMHTLIPIAMQAFEGVDLQPSGVWFRNTRFVEVGPSGAYLQWNVTTEFEYDEVR